MAITDCTCYTGPLGGAPGGYNQTKDLLRTCLTINRPFYHAEISIKCYDQLHHPPGGAARGIADCVLANEEAKKYVTLYATPTKVVITGNKRDPHGWGYFHSTAMEALQSSTTISPRRLQSRASTYRRGTPRRLCPTNPTTRTIKTRCTAR